MAEGLRGFVTEHKRGVRTTAAGLALVAGAALTGCSSGGDREVSQHTPPAATSESGEPGFGVKPECHFAGKDRVRKGEALWVQAGVAALPNNEAIVGRMRYSPDGKRLSEVQSVPTVPTDTLQQRLTGGFAIGRTFDVGDLTLYRRGSINPDDDTCTPKSGDPEARRPAPDAQLVTATGWVNEAASGKTYLGFNDGPRGVHSPIAAHTEGAVGVQFAQVPQGYTS